jgi:hypothetical protein
MSFNPERPILNLVVGREFRKGKPVCRRNR